MSLLALLLMTRLLAAGVAVLLLAVHRVTERAADRRRGRVHGGEPRRVRLRAAAAALGDRVARGLRCRAGARGGVGGLAQPVLRADADGADPAGDRVVVSPRARVEDTPVNEIATTLGIEPTQVPNRIDRMLKRLKVEIPAPRAAG